MADRAVGQRTARLEADRAALAAAAVFGLALHGAFLRNVVPTHGWHLPGEVGADRWSARLSSILLLGALGRLATLGQRRQAIAFVLALVLDQAEIDLALFHAGLQYQDAHAVAQAVAAAAAFAGQRLAGGVELVIVLRQLGHVHQALHLRLVQFHEQDRKSTRLNSSHSQISYAVFCLKKKKNIIYKLATSVRRVTILISRTVR